MWTILAVVLPLWSGQNISNMAASQGAVAAGEKLPFSAGMSCCTLCKPGQEPARSPAHGSSDTWSSPADTLCQGRTLIFKRIKWGHRLILPEWDSANQSKTSDIGTHIRKLAEKEVFWFCTHVKVLLSYHTVEILHYKSNVISISNIYLKYPK